MLQEDEAAIQTALGADVAEADCDTLLERMTVALRFAMSRKAEAKDLAAAQKAREERYKHRVEVLRHEILQVLLALERPTFWARYGTLSQTTIAPSLVILDEEAIPDEYLIEETIKRPDKLSIAEDLEAGVVIDGCVLSNGGIGLAFRPARARKGRGNDAELFDRGD